MWSWENIGWVVVRGVVAYTVLLLLIRISGKRTLAKLNAFDLVVTVALGSTLSAAVLAPSGSLADGLAAIAVLIAAQYAVAWSQVRSRAIRRLIKSEPSLLVYRGEWIDATLKAERVSRDEVLAVLRSQGVPRVDAAGAVVLETDGSFSVLRDVPGPADGTLSDVRSR